MFHRPLICTDFTDGLHRLVHHIPALVSAGMNHIVFLHNAPLWEEGEIPRVDTEKVKAARDRLEVALQQVPAGAEVVVEVPSGRTRDLILQAAKNHQADLIVLGMPSRNLLAEKLFGSDTMALCQQAPIPLLILRPQMISTYTREELDLRCQHLFRQLLVPYDDSHAAQYLVAQLKQTLQPQQTADLETLLLCRVVDDSGQRNLSRDYLITEAQKSLEPLQAEFQSLGLQTQMQVRQGDPVVEILAAAREEDISEIALSSDSLGGLLEWSVPSLTGEILRRSWHPVLYFPPQR